MTKKTSQLAWVVTGVVAVASQGCALSHDLDAESGGGSLSSNTSTAGLTLPEDCLELNRPGIPPRELRCTGLYTDVEGKELQDGMREFAPAIPFWSDGAAKRRWIYLPPGEQIDTSNPDAWLLPVGTRLFKEFKVNGKRVETRLYHREDENRWIKASYKWDEDETKAERFVGGEFMFDGEPYYIPTAQECDKCHKGDMNDRVLGFEAIMLGLPGAKGVTLDVLREEGLLSDEDGMPETMKIGDDGTGEAAEAFGWMHSNCGISCHSADTATEAYRTGLRLRLNLEDVSGNPADDFESYGTIVGQDATVERWLGETRVVPGSAQESLLYKVIARRTPQAPNNSMPPLATFVPERDGVRAVERWINALDDELDGPF